MSSEELVRSELHERLAEVVGAHGTAYLMARVAPMEWDKLATKEDLHAVRAELAADIAETARELVDLRRHTEHEFALVRIEMAALKHEVIGAFRAELTASLASQARILVVQHVVLFLAFAGFALATR